MTPARASFEVTMKPKDKLLFKTSVCWLFPILLEREVELGCSRASCDRQTLNMRFVPGRVDPPDPNKRLTTVSYFCVLDGESGENIKSIPIRVWFPFQQAVEEYLGVCETRGTPHNGALLLVGLTNLKKGAPLKKHKPRDTKCAKTHPFPSGSRKATTSLHLAPRKF